jgi:DNA modification methylase
MNNNADSVSKIKEFLMANKIELDVENFLKPTTVKNGKFYPLPDDIIPKIIGDAFESSKPYLNMCVRIVEDHYNIFLGRIKKNQLKKYIDYGNSSDLYKFAELTGVEVSNVQDLEIRISGIISEYQGILGSAVDEFLNKLRCAIKKNDKSRISDYLNFLYSRLVGINEYRTLSLKDIFDFNSQYLHRELSTQELVCLASRCEDETKYEREITIQRFNNEYIKILQDRGDQNEKASVIYISLNQAFYDKFKDKYNFYDYIFEFIENAYEKLQNHKTFAVRIQDVFDGEKNIKWEIYSLITVYAEVFKSYIESRSYYHPWLIAKDFLKQKYKIILTREDEKAIEGYYKGKVDFEYLKEHLTSVLNKTILDSFKYIEHGFTFSDCFILRKPDGRRTKEIDFINNDTELLLIFFKQEIDDRKIPCPVCASLNVSGNSFPEIGVRSWECKNPLCFERSKTNRGKRYSLRSILMQNGAFDFSPENQIQKSVTKKWRKDVIEKFSLEDIYTMLIKYYSYPDDLLIALNPEEEELFLRLSQSEKRKYKSITINDFVKPEIVKGKYYSFLSTSEFLKRFLYKKNVVTIKDEFKQNFPVKYNNSKPLFILGDSYFMLDRFQNDSVHNLVTSPPYYNTREYSQWSNLYSYLNDMYNIITKALDKLVPGGVFFYNIGDTYGNDNTKVKSKMGERRIPLGAYTVILFLNAGYELVDNVIWNKGEPQSNRHLNDGNFTPYYQRPANCYEHIFIFKKKGKIHLCENRGPKSLNSNLLSFSPVIKIGKGGENRLGHTAPYPEKIPELSIFTFTNEGELVIDPFSGSGTSAIVATRNKRVGIGIDANPTYVTLSEERAKKQLSFQHNNDFS